MAGQHDEANLLQRFASGEEKAVRAVYARYSGPVMTVAMSVLGDRGLAEEAVQATMLKAWRASASFDPSRELAPWLYAIARRVAIDLYRRERRAATPEDLDDNQLVVFPLSFERTWEAWEVRTALDQLPVEERDVARLAHLDGLTHREIAERLGVPVGTVKSRSSRAHQRLAALLRHVVEVGK